jgi:peptidyl-prolyl cis-trans isomerase A (cyclophilin A)
MKLVMFVLLAVVLLLSAETHAFHVGPLSKATSSSALYSSSRRDVVGAASVAAAAILARGLPVNAAEEGKVVAFQVENLDGTPGNSGTIKIQLHPEWAPNGVKRFEELTSESFWEGCRFFRVLPGFVSQFGINGDPVIQAKWRNAKIKDDPVLVSNKRGTVVFATAGPGTRTSQIFINTRQQGNEFLDKQGFSPIGEVIEGMEIVDRFYAGYGEGAPSGKGPSQALIQAKGNEYLESSFPKLTYISKASFVN